MIKNTKNLFANDYYEYLGYERVNKISVYTLDNTYILNTMFKIIILLLLLLSR